MDHPPPGLLAGGAGDPHPPPRHLPSLLRPGHGRGWRLAAAGGGEGPLPLLQEHGLPRSLPAQELECSNFDIYVDIHNIQ